MGLSVVVAEAPAKVNLYLNVGEQRPDGYHQVDTVLHTLALHDTVTIRRADGLTVTCDPDVGVPPEQNLAYRAAAALAAATGRSADVEISIEKRIPHGAGLAGGSSDAAATLVGLAALWEIEPADPVLGDIAAVLGADVPYLLTGGAAVYAGRGDELVTALSTVVADVVLVKPLEVVSTGAAYVAFDLLVQPTAPDVGVMARAVRDSDTPAVASALHNNMTEASLTLAPVIGEALAWVQSFDDVLGAAMAGSGSAVFAFCAGTGTAQRIAHEAQARGWWATATTTTARGAHVVETEEHA